MRSMARLIILLLLFSQAAYSNHALNQVAVQLGADDLGYDLSSASGPQVAAALERGQLLLKEKGTAEQSPAKRLAILRATMQALQSPVTLVNRDLRVSLDPRKTTPSAILKQVLRRIPNYSPILAEYAVSSTFLTAGPNSVWGLRKNTDTVKNKHAGQAAALSMRYGMKAYRRGTQNWAPVPRSGPLPGDEYLPNFSKKEINGQAANTEGIPEAAAAIAAAAINGLGTNQNVASIEELTRAMTREAKRTQKISSDKRALDGEVSITLVAGSIGGSMVGLVSQVAGVDQTSWLGSTNADLLEAIVTGAVRATRNPMHLYAIGYGVAAGFGGTYQATFTGQFNGVDMSGLADQIFAALNISQRKLASKKWQTIAENLDLVINAGASHGTVVPNIVPGYKGVNGFTHNNNTGTPVTDTVGL